MQTRRKSFVESVFNTLSAYLISVLIYLYVMPLFGFHPSLGESFLFTGLFSVVSILRNYLVRRLFNYLEGR